VVHNNDYMPAARRLSALFELLVLSPSLKTTATYSTTVGSHLYRSA